MDELDYEHREVVTTRAKRGEDIIRDLTPAKAHLWHMASCLGPEAGELFDSAKQIAIYNKPFTTELFDNMVEELGDMEFYLEGYRQAVAAVIAEMRAAGEVPAYTDADGISRSMTLEENIKKLTKRYPTTYSNEDAAARVDKQLPDPEPSRH